MFWVRVGVLTSVLAKIVERFGSLCPVVRVQSTELESIGSGESFRNVKCVSSDDAFAEIKWAQRETELNPNKAFVCDDGQNHPRSQRKLFISVFLECYFHLLDCSF